VEVVEVQLHFQVQQQEQEEQVVVEQEVIPWSNRNCWNSKYWRWWRWRW
jgi:hypothetical protein